MSRVPAIAPEDRAGPEGSKLRDAVERAQRHLLSLQADDGHWCGELEGDSILESEYALTLHYLGKSGTPKFAKIAAHLRSQQTSTGGWAIYPGGPTDVSASVKAYFVLKLAGDDPEAPHMRRTREVVLRAGGLEACNSFTKIYLAIFGQFPWSRCPSVPPELVLLPRWVPFQIGEMSSWSRGILVPLSLISARQPRCPVPDHAGIAELATGEPRTPLRTPWDPAFHAADLAIKRAERFPFDFLRRIAIARAERWILDRLEDSHGVGAIFPPIVNTIIGLSAIGYPLDHPVIRSQVRELERLEIEEESTLRVQPCFSPVWDTAYAIHALVESGVPSDDPALVRAAIWMTERRGDRRGDWAATNDCPHAGFYFEYANPFYPDCDTTAQAITALSRVDAPAGDARRRCQEALFRAHAWHLSMQNGDGGWAAFDRGNDRQRLTRVPFADHNAMIDPSTADLTARAIEALVDLGFGGEYPAVRRGVEFLRASQEADGSWYGRWGCNYLYGTSLSLSALSRSGTPSDAPEVRRAVLWLESVQNGDGGWGETPATYEDPSQKGLGESTASQTAWALLGLIASGGAHSESVERGIQFLLDTQSPDGSWSETAWTGTGFPRVFYLRDHYYPLYFPLLALGAFAKAREPKPRRSRARDNGLLHVAPPGGGPR